MNTIVLMIDSLLAGLTYTSEQLERFSCLSAIFVQNEILFPTKYTVDILNRTISPNPTDNDFCFLVALYATILIVKQEIKTSSDNSIKVIDGPSTIDLSGNSSSLLKYYQTLLDEYNQLKISYLRSGKLGHTGLVITTPI